MLTGDETGVLLGDHVLRHGSAHGSAEDRLVATTVVSSSMLRSVAAAHGARFAETLTGFKWIARAGPGLVYGYEEALGYCVDPDAVRDKDGIAAAVLACDLAATLKAAGAGLLDRLDELATAHGVHATAGLPIRMAPAERDAVVERLRARPPEGWTADRPAPDVLVLRRAGERAVIRPSGTEPKLKAYLQVVEPLEGDLAAARAPADARLPRCAPRWRPVARLLIVHHTPVARDGGAARRGPGARSRRSPAWRWCAAPPCRPGPPMCSPPTPCCSARRPTSATCRAR